MVKLKPALLTATYCSSKHPTVFELDKRDEYFILKLNKTPVNSLDLETLTALNTQLDEFEQNNDLKGVILTSVSFQSGKVLENF